MHNLLLAAPASVSSSIAAGLFGLLLGSFLNVVVHRLPIMRQREVENYLADRQGDKVPFPDRYDLSMPRSACPRCGHQIRAWENVPVLSWLFLRGRCSSCDARISSRYPLVEATTGALSATLVWHFGSGWTGLGALAFTYLLIALTLIDYDHKELPDDLTYPLLWLGLLVNLNGVFVPLREAVLGAAGGYSCLWVVSRGYEKIRGQVGMGDGDLKLLAALGAWFSWKMLLPIILISSIAGAASGAAAIVLGWRKRGQYMPFGPCLAIAGMMGLLLGPDLVRMMLRVAL